MFLRAAAGTASQSLVAAGLQWSGAAGAGGPSGLVDGRDSNRLGAIEGNPPFPSFSRRASVHANWALGGARGGAVPVLSRDDWFCDAPSDAAGGACGARAGGTTAVARGGTNDAAGGAPLGAATGGAACCPVCWIASCLSRRKSAGAPKCCRRVT